jgi:adenylate kinase family enzyme
MQRISVVGTSGSGKTTLARQIAQRLSIPHIELDPLHWEPNWVEVPDEVMQERVIKALSSDRWVVDGNYSQVRDIIWAKADTVVFLDYSFLVVMNRLLWRTFWRSVTQQEVCNGNQESLKKAFLSRDSILLWMLQTYSRNRKQYPILLQKPEYAHINLVHLISPQAAKNWLTSLKA